MIVHRIVAQGGTASTNLADQLSLALAGKSIDRLDVAVAYATSAGLKVLRSITVDWPEKTRWVVGLDDAITQPFAITTIVDLPESVVRLCRMGPSNRFHPKMYCYWSSIDPLLCIAAIGSANMTDHGLRTNAESAVILMSETKAEADQIKEIWFDLYELGIPVTDFDLNGYQELHAKACKARRRMSKIGALPAQPEADEPETTDSDGANFEALAWLDFGSAMGNGREIELPKILLPFFGIGDSTTSPQIRNFRFQGNGAVGIPIVRRNDNGMWRITFGTAIPGSEVLKRKIVNGVKLRSDQAVSFRRLGDGTFDAKFVKIGSPEYQSLVLDVKINGTFGTTKPGPTGKNYGFR